ncbi:MAG: amidohydrolase family protein [Candidatus Aminicenantes bacterium]|nr:amidohydrolase family protein [Candidatus Aminicenantes bacterium]
MKKNITRRDFLKKSSKAVAAAGLGGCGVLLKGCTSKQDFDLVIKDGYIFDGLGNEAFKADIGISGSFIQEIGKISSSSGKSVVDANNLAVCPGFIDAHDHTDMQLLVNPKAESSIRQGITTLVSGNCGGSPFPIAEKIYEEMKEDLKAFYQIDLTWKDIKGFFAKLEEKGMALNYSSLVGQGTIRGAAVGFNDRPPKEEELEKMKKMVAESIKNGAVGLSTGLEYAPGSYAKNDEIEELCRVAAYYGGVYATHMRNEGDYLLESLDEAIEVARKTGISLQISHFKIAYPRNWHKIDAALARVEKAKEEGISIFCDRYSYIAGSTGLSYYFPLWARQGTTDEFLARLKDPALDDKLRAHSAEEELKLGSWDKVVISSVVSEKNRQFEGKSVLQGAKEKGKSPYEFMRDILIEERNRVGMVTFMMKEENLKKILAHPLVGVGCDGSAIAPYGILGRGKPHPRHYGTFPRVLGKYIREEKIVPMPEMIKKMTSLPARKFGFTKRGSLEKGYFADLVIFDEDRVIDKATWTDPHQYPVGIEYVLVNGKIVIKSGEHTGSLPGKVLRKEVKV